MVLQNSKYTLQHTQESMQLMMVLVLEDKKLLETTLPR